MTQASSSSDNDEGGHRERAPFFFLVVIFLTGYTIGELVGMLLTHWLERR
jgi:hypothetical protein